MTVSIPRTGGIGGMGGIRQAGRPDLSRRYQVGWVA